ncbi:hypothetical protein N0V94_000542 [Neodidymelliopsis sp. IMI 364377]|nr:hypothetical protein N0V94_000542 [Neodidymelliopsis sp. IMI 364377]
MDNIESARDDWLATVEEVVAIVSTSAGARARRLGDRMSERDTKDTFKPEDNSVILDTVAGTMLEGTGIREDEYDITTLLEVTLEEVTSGSSRYGSGALTKGETGSGALKEDTTERERSEGGTIETIELAGEANALA